MCATQNENGIPTFFTTNFITKCNGNCKLGQREGLQERGNDYPKGFVSVERPLLELRPPRHKIPEIVATNPGITISKLGDDLSKAHGKQPAVDKKNGAYHAELKHCRGSDQPLLEKQFFDR